MSKPTNIQNANLVRRRDTRNDRYYTPTSLVHIHLRSLATNEEVVVLEPCRGSGAYWNALPIFFPNCYRPYCEIDEGLDFFNYDGPKPDIIVTNPPFSLMDKFIEKMVSLQPLIISLLLNMYAVTPCRIRDLNKQGYFVTKYLLVRVDRWFGVSVIVTLSREATHNIIDFDCVKHKLEN